MITKYKLQIVNPNSFEPENHFYPKVLNSQIHPMVGHFFNLSMERIIKRYCHLNPKVDSLALKKILTSKCKHFFWGGCDLFYVTTVRGERKMVVLETNSCPSGQKSMPPLNDSDEHRGYGKLISQSFLQAIKNKKLPKGGLAVIYDKNYLEASGYACTLADLTQEKVYLVPLLDGEKSQAKFINGVLNIQISKNEKVPIRAALRYVTQKPWNRIPLVTKTFIYNSTLVCLAGGRNKLLASKAYELYNSEIQSSGVRILFPETIRDVYKTEIPLWVQKFGGRAVIKIPYSNAGQGVYTITNDKELRQFMAIDHKYDQFIVQSLIGHYNWSSVSVRGNYYHIGTVPDKNGKIYVADLRMMIYSTPKGFFPAAIYARKTKEPLESVLPKDKLSWEFLGTNLSIKKGENIWDSDTNRLMLMDRKDFNALGIGIDDLIEAYIQSVLSILAIDKMAIQLIGKDGKFKQKLFESLDNDQSLIKEILIS